jgi:hypothetical protein
MKLLEAFWFDGLFQRWNSAEKRVGSLRDGTLGVNRPPIRRTAMLGVSDRVSAISDATRPQMKAGATIPASAIAVPERSLRTVTSRTRAPS